MWDDALVSLREELQLNVLTEIGCGNCLVEWQAELWSKQFKVCTVREQSATSTKQTD